VSGFLLFVFLGAGNKVRRSHVNSAIICEMKYARMYDGYTIVEKRGRGKRRSDVDHTSYGSTSEKRQVASHKHI